MNGGRTAIPPRRRAGFLLLALFIPLIGALGCRSDSTENEAAAPPAAENVRADHEAACRAILEADTRLGKERNHLPEKVGLAEAARRYVAGIDALDFSACPNDFTAAFRKHRDTWKSSIEVLEQHAELRGEMHDLFDQIRQLDAPAPQRLKSIEDPIWSTWAEVETAARKYNAMD